LLQLYFLHRKEQKDNVDHTTTNKGQPLQFSRDDGARSIASVLQQVFAELHIQHTVAGIAVLPAGGATFIIDVVLYDQILETTWGITVMIPPHEEGRIDALDWNKQFKVLTISRGYLLSIGMHPEQVARLTDEDMSRIAEMLIAHHFDLEFDTDVVFTARLVLAEKRSQ
jgi:hypothetical protein